MLVHAELTRYIQDLIDNFLCFLGLRNDSRDVAALSGCVWCS